MALEYDLAIIGRVFDVTDSVPVSADDIRKYCEAIGETNPLFIDEAAAKQGPHGRLSAPPSFAVTFRTGRDFWQHIPRFGRSGFDAGKDVEFMRPIFPEDKITLSSHVKEIYEKTGRSGSMVFVIIRSTLNNQFGETVAHIDHRFMHRA
jgi:acyl dehydratase